MKHFQDFASKVVKLVTGDSLKSKIAVGSLWLGGGNGIEQGLRFLRNIIITRLLAPEVFGIMAIVLAISEVLDSLTELGIRTAIIQNPKGHERTYLNGAWWLSFIRGASIYAILFLCAPYIAEFYDNPSLTPLMRLAFLSIFFRGATSPKAFVAVKEFDFKRWVIIQNGGGVIGILTTVILSFIIQNVWALVIGFTAEAFSRFILSYFICPYCPGIKFEKEHIRSLIQFTRGMVGLPIFTAIFMRADVFVLGKLVTKSELGLYSMAASLAYVATHLVTQLFGQLMTPAFSAIQTEKDRLNKVLLRITTYIAFFCFPLLMFTIVYGKDLLHIVYGQAYAEVAIPFAILFATSTMQVCGIPIASLYFATGNPQLHRIFVILRAALIVTLIYPAVKWFGLIGAASAGFISMFVGYVLQIRRLHKITGLELLKYNRILLIALVTSLCVPFIWLLSREFITFHLLFNIAIGLFGCFLSYSLFILFFFKLKKLHQYFQF